MNTNDFDNIYMLPVYGIDRCWECGRYASVEFCGRIHLFPYDPRWLVAHANEDKAIVFRSSQQCICFQCLDRIGAVPLTFSK